MNNIYIILFSFILCCGFSGCNNHSTHHLLFREVHSITICEVNLPGKSMQITGPAIHQIVYELGESHLSTPAKFIPHYLMSINCNRDTTTLRINGKSIKDPDGHTFKMKHTIEEILDIIPTAYILYSLDDSI